ncbi:MAG: RNA polymerase factor sigma-54 [Chromatiaceae bacterium]|nr:RNA polymerase factor sigma-54 [Gammaproteobacteria bacterium]MCP5305200.1 RNA polymerase factor sigma-54 [Chromatiaceae bacterium]MCP5315159.1 RNA polymerase factor sigma-54 [Chromatiaceae bacterium]
MKPTIQLRLGQHLTMTPQLQQAIKLLQLSTLDLKQEIQDALESNLMLEAEEESSRTDDGDSERGGLTGESDGADQLAAEPGKNDPNNESEISIESESMPDELPVDTVWDDIYDSVTPVSSAGAGGGDENQDFLNQQSVGESLRDHLVWQMQLTPFSPTDLAIAEAIIDAINDDGYLSAPLEDILASTDIPDIELDEVEAVLHRVQAFDPPGIAARDLRECLLLQLRQLPEDFEWRREAITLVDEHFDLLAQQDEAQMRRRLKLEGDELLSVIHLIRSLNPRPGTSVASESPSYIEPDVFVYKHNNQWRVELNPDAAPKLRVNAEYASMIRRADNSADNVTMKNHLQEARWFIKSLQSRNDTLLRVATRIVDFQRNFFEYGEEAMKPLVLRDIAEALEMHESTISRVTTQKYMHTPRGTLEFKYFFSSHVSTASGGEASATAIRALIKKLIGAEKPNKPLSDNKIAAILADQGINVARRTVAKYRESMAIPPSNERKRLA